MTPFRRCGLADEDEIGASPVALRYRHPRTLSYCSGSDTKDDGGGGDSAWEEDSVVSAMTTISDLESVYNETSSKFHPLNLRERFLLRHRLPQPSRTVSMVLSEHERRLLSTVATAHSINDLEDEKESWEDEDILDNNFLPENPHERHEPRPMAYAKVFLDPHEKGIVGSFDLDVWFEREGIPLPRILERDESSQSSV